MHTIAWSDQLRVLAARMGSATAVTDDQGHSLSYAQLSQQAHQCAQALLARGFTSGQSIGVWLPNSLDAVRCAYAIRLMGGAETPLSWSLTEPELQWCCGLAQVQAVITRAERAEQVRACGMQPLLMEDLWPAQETALSGPLPVVPASDMGRILFTSGTTGKPKGVIYTHGARWVGEQMLKAAMPFVPDAGAPLLLMTPFVHLSLIHI